MIEGRSVSEDREDVSLALELDLSTLKAEVLSKAVECQSRGLTQSFKFLSELGYSLRHVSVYEAGGVPNDLNPSEECKVSLIVLAHQDQAEQLYSIGLSLQNIQ